MAAVRGPFDVVGAAALAASVAGVAALWTARMRHIGIRIEPQGILAVYAVGHVRLPLESVTGFSVQSNGAGVSDRRVVIELLDGGRRAVPSALPLDWGAIRNRRRTTAGARPGDVVAQLAGQLQRARQQAAAALTDSLPPAL
ncbi:MAG TPA: hypothetical protein VMF07_09055 [Solirubrobacteraceae bacterium]|nr:hypothetical protein [Solirubrobacteraceae bacterium]